MLVLRGGDEFRGRGWSLGEIECLALGRELCECSGVCCRQEQDKAKGQAQWEPFVKPVLNLGDLLLLDDKI